MPHVPRPFYRGFLHFKINTAVLFTDTHTHLYSEAFREDSNQIVERALQNGVTRFFLPAIDSTYISAMLALQKEYPDRMFLMAGLHPTHVKQDFETELKAVEEMLQTHKCWAIGETGIDLYWDTTFLKEQKAAFARQLRWAKKLDLPIVIHCRDAFDEVFEVLEAEKHPNMRGIFHCFTGNFEQAQKAIGYGLKLGIGGVVTFKNGGINRFLHQIDIKKIVLETDAPYLAPVPHRGKRNESAYLPLIAQKVAEIYGMSLEEVASITTANSRDIFRF